MTEFLLANILWASLAAIAAVGLVWTIIRDGAKLIDHDAAILLIKSDGGVFVDLRTAAAFTAGRIAHARHIPAAELKKRAAEIERYREKPVVLVCDNGMQSRRSLRELVALGFAQARALRGGMVAWTDAQLPVLRK